MPLVSICIPTYNRVINLEKTIESIVNKNEFLSGKVELVISDNNSTDNTESLCNKYKKYDSFKYYKNDKNLIDENFYLALIRVRGIYRKLHNDSFVFNDIGLSYVCDEIEKYKSEKPSIFFTTAALRLDAVEYKCDFSEAVKKINYWLTCINFIGFWENEIEKIDNDKEIFGKCLWQTENSLKIMNNKKDVVICNKQIGIQLHILNKDVSYGIFRVFHDNFISILNKYVDKEKLSIDIVSKIEKDLLFNKFLYDLVNFKVGLLNKNCMDKENFENALIDYYSTKNIGMNLNAFIIKN